MAPIKPTCRIDGQECDYHIRYEQIFGQKFMLRLSECRLTNSKGYYPTHIDHCNEQVKEGWNMNEDNKNTKTPTCPVCGHMLITESEINEDPFLKDVTASWVCPKGCTFDQEQIGYLPYKLQGKYVSKKELEERDNAPNSKEYEEEMKKLKEKQAGEKPYIVALEHKDHSQENVIINAETPGEALDILWRNASSTVKDCSEITIGLIEKIWGNEFYRRNCANDKLHMESLEDKIVKLRKI